MIKHSALLATSLAVVSLTACSKKEPQPAADMTSAPATDAMGDTAAAPAQSPAQAFANLAAASDMFEIETSKLAAENAQSGKVKAFAEQMIKAHTDSTRKLTEAAEAATPPITPAPSLTAAQRTQLADLEAMTGAAFDKAYAKAQVSAHQATLDALNGYAAGGDQASLKTFAKDVVPTVTAHLNMAKGL
ncbi:DUF4142 domain-containing protein [Novosphingobium aerophilum]|uniref:DUF4142 domain-containing protein n=1 Tax=Novosphingobium aerophilum TaxID=2839843 RepID=UPI0017CA5E10